MGTSSRFTVAIHILTILAIEKKEEPTTSEYLARSAGTNPVVIRRILSPLQKDGLVETQPGAGGCTRLACSPEEITLLRVFQTVEDNKPFAYGDRKDNPYCICSRNLEPVLTKVFDNVKNAMESVLAETTIAELATKIKAQDSQKDWITAPIVKP